MDLNSLVHACRSRLPTGENIRLLRSWSRPAPFFVNGSYAISALGLCIVIIGLQAFTCGHGTYRKGAAVIEKYQESSTGAIRTHSDQERQYVGRARARSRTGGIFKFIGIVIVLLGIIIFFYPHLLFYELKRLHIVGENSLCSRYSPPVPGAPDTAPGSPKAGTDGSAARPRTGRRKRPAARRTTALPKSKRNDSPLG